MIRSFKDEDSRKVWERTFVKKFGRDITKMAYRKLLMIDAATNINDLRVPPRNRLKKLDDKGNSKRRGQHSIHINDQFRICFTWKEDGAHDVEITDYHDD